MKIPLTKPFWDKNEQKIAQKAISEFQAQGDGKYTKKLVKVLTKLTGAKYVIPVTSCTHGLELVANCLGLAPGDEVILPSFTMTSTANAIVLAGATPVFADIDPVYFCIDPEDVEKKITKKTKGIFVIHYAGMTVQMDKLKKLANKHKLFIVEDAAHAVGAYFKGKMLGNLGLAGVYSFHGTKNISCGEGGLVLTNDKSLYDKMEIFRANGTNRKQFLDGLVDRYSWIGKGTSYFLSDLLSAILLSQFKKLRKINTLRKKIATKYNKAFEKYKDVINLPTVPKYSIPNWHIYAIKFNKISDRNIFLTKMRKKGIDVAYHYVPLHTSMMGKIIHAKKPDLPVTNDVFSTLIRLPIYPSLSKKELDFIITTALKILKELKN